jgi:hypothetical protein
MTDNVSADYSKVPESALIALGQLILKRAEIVSIPCTTKEQAIRVIRGIKPAPPRKSRQRIKPRLFVVPTVPLCNVCYKEMPVGTLCDSQGKHHITCGG